MEKKNAQPRTAELSANTRRKYTEVKNPRQLRVLHALMVRPRPREEMDRIAGCSNSPSQIASLRGKGFDIPCVMVRSLDCDGLLVYRGVYYLTAADRRMIARHVCRKGA
ncbi:hypothetical protein R75461_07671 [Paraburkholderia nemoris]|uniref:hypothetical protein n=1 Tax=Paraburkholderia nemoris TaxID=2793076 RepID=UPI00190AC65A|nr:MULTISPECIES: hypothetical protein [Paraburkholderia]MBK3786433.1 hypothetical protein [Paraburkholderia aspalathi]CAE6855210.1 hypothetical protein R75461_07671 [Paraburkholderia nemoris]